MVFLSPRLSSGPLLCMLMCCTGGDDECVIRVVWSGHNSSQGMSGTSVFEHLSLHTISFEFDLLMNRMWYCISVSVNGVTCLYYYWYIRMVRSCWHGSPLGILRSLRNGCSNLSRHVSFPCQPNDTAAVVFCVFLVCVLVHLR